MVTSLWALDQTGSATHVDGEVDPNGLRLADVQMSAERQDEPPIVVSVCYILVVTQDTDFRDHLIKRNAKILQVLPRPLLRNEHESNL